MAEIDAWRADGDLDARLAALVQSSADAIIGTTPEELITSWNFGAERLYGYSAEEAIGQPAAMLVPPARLHRENRLRRRVLEGRRVEQYETERLRKDGALVAVGVSASPINDSGGDVVGVATIEHEITDWKRARAALRDAEARFNSTFDGAAIGMALVSIDADELGRFLQVNPAFCALTGYTQDQLGRLDFQALTHPDDLDEDLMLLGRLLAGELPSYEIESRYIHLERHTIWALVTSALVRDDAGTPLYCIRQIQDIQERKHFERRLEHLADHDALTGLLSRACFVRELSRQMSYARRYGEEGAVLFLDLDRFKDVNDTLGHNVGDELIVSVAHSLRDRLRTTDILARLGGDEFAVVLPGADADEAAGVAHDLMTAVRDKPFVTMRRSIPLTASVGITLFRPGAELTADDLLIEADLAMYEAKDLGGDHVAFSRAEQQAKMEERLTSIQRMRKALDDDLLVLYRQPILDLRTNEVSQYELLLRMPGPNGEVLLPASFLYTAERFGLIRDIDRWVVRRAIELIAAEQSAGRELRLEVNISGMSVTDPELPQFIERQLDAASVDPASLILEVTETAAIGNMDEALAFIARLTDIGCRFALDDFGAGFGSFYYLKYLNLDYLKIDGEFIRHLPASTTDQLILESIVQMAAGLGKATIAEYVSDEETVRLLREHGVNYAQGYHVGRPEPLGETWRVTGSGAGGA